MILAFPGYSRLLFAKIKSNSGDRNTVNSEIFARILFFANRVKRHISTYKNLRLRHDLPISENNRVITPFRSNFIFTYTKFSEYKTLVKISELTVHSTT